MRPKYNRSWVKAGIARRYDYGMADYVDNQPSLYAGLYLYEKCKDSSGHKAHLHNKNDKWCVGNVYDRT